MKAAAARDPIPPPTKNACGFALMSSRLSEEFGSVSIEFALRLVVKAMNPGKVAVRDQVCLRRQPMLHITSGLRTLVLIIEVCLSGHLIRRWHKVNCFLV